MAEAPDEGSFIQLLKCQQYCIAHRIPRRKHIHVPNPINLNNHPVLPASKVREVRPNRQLPHKLEAIEPAAAQLLPQSSLSLGVILPKCPGTGEGCFGLVGHKRETDERNDSVAKFAERKGPNRALLTFSQSL